MKLVSKIVLSVVAAFALSVVTGFWSDYASPQVGANLAVASVNGSSHDFYASHIYEKNKTVVNSGAVLAFLLVMVLLWQSNVKALVTPKTVPLFLMIAIMAASTGCMRKYDVPEYVEVSSSQTAFVIPLEESSPDAQAKFNSEQYFESKKVAGKRIQIAHRWNKTGRSLNDTKGDWIPTVKVILVDRQPVTQEWESRDGQSKGKDQAIWIESADSVGFSMGWSCTAYIQEADASKFLYWYPSGSLPNVMNQEIRARIQQVAAEVAAGYKLDELRSRKLEIASAVKSNCMSFFATRGVTITTIGMFGGMSYENPAIQQAIDQTFVSQQEKVNAAAFLAAQEDKNKRILSEADAMAMAAAKKGEGEARAITFVNEALAKAANNPQLIQLRWLEVEKAHIDKWDGISQYYPDVVSGDGANTWVGLGTGVGGAIKPVESK